MELTVDRSTTGDAPSPDVPSGDFLNKCEDGYRGTTRYDLKGAVGLEFLDPSDVEGHLGRLGPYEVTGVLGRGGMGVVLKGIDPFLNRLVAIKVLAPHLAVNEVARKRFACEARASAAVSNPHIVAIHTVGGMERLPFLVMEYVPGVSLQEKISREGALELVDILRTTMQVAAGLAAAHARGLVHRDVKPANILLGDDGKHAKITDFGLAHIADDPSLTHTGNVVGTPEFMAPEQAEGGPVDHRADLFSLGGVVYTMCTGQPPFAGRNALAVMRKVCEATPRPIREQNSAIPEWLEEIVQKLLAKNLDERYQSAAEVAEAIGQHLVALHDPTHPKAISSVRPKVQRVVRPTRTTRRLAWAAALLALVCSGGGAMANRDATDAVPAHTPSAIRIPTPSGTYVVEIADPQLKVAVHPGGVTIRGAGISEVNLSRDLRPRNKSDASRSGPVEVLTLNRGGKQVLRATIEAPPTG